MNKAIEANLERMEQEIHKALVDCAERMKSCCMNVGESVEAMAVLIEIVSEKHQAAIWALIGAMLDISKEDNVPIPLSILRKTVDQCMESFSKDLVNNIRESCESSGYPNIFDPNNKVREEILNGDL